MLDNLWKIVNKDFSGEGLDMLKDIKIMSDEYPFDAVMKVGGTKETSEDMNLTSEEINNSKRCREENSDEKFPYLYQEL